MPFIEILQGLSGDHTHDDLEAQMDLQAKVPATGTKEVAPQGRPASLKL
jgi:hypothetical protein